MANELDFDVNTDIGQYVKDWEADRWLSEGMLDPDVMSSILMQKQWSKSGVPDAISVLCPKICLYCQQCATTIGHPCLAWLVSYCCCALLTI